MLILAGAVTLLLACSGTAPAAPGGDRPAQLKAAFVLNFARFVEWPRESFPDATSPLVIGILGADVFKGALDDVVADKVIDGRRIAVARFANVRDALGAHVLFISDSEQRELPNILRQVRGRPILTVSEIERFVEEGGVIRLKTVRDMIRFDINRAAAESSRLRISSKLLKLAENLRD